MRNNRLLKRVLTAVSDRLAVVAGRGTGRLLVRCVAHVVATGAVAGDQHSVAVAVDVAAVGQIGCHLHKTVSDVSTTDDTVSDTVPDAISNTIYHSIATRFHRLGHYCAHDTLALQIGKILPPG